MPRCELSADKQKKPSQSLSTPFKLCMMTPLVKKQAMKLRPFLGKKMQKIHFLHLKSYKPQLFWDVYHRFHKISTPPVSDGHLTSWGRRGVWWGGGRGRQLQGSWESKALRIRCGWCLPVWFFRFSSFFLFGWRFFSQSFGAAQAEDLPLRGIWILVSRFSFGKSEFGLEDTCFLGSFLGWKRIVRWRSRGLLAEPPLRFETKGLLGASVSSFCFKQILGPLQHEGLSWSSVEKTKTGTFFGEDISVKA